MTIVYRPCYVCGDQVNIETDQYCYKEFDDEVIKFRHLWHGVPGITRTIGGAGGFAGYATTLEDARRRAEQYLTGSSSPYAAPEVQRGEQAILDEVNRLEKLTSIS